MGLEIIIETETEETRCAIIEDNVLSEIYLERKISPVGNIYKGKVKEILPGMEAAFIDIGTEKNAYLGITDLEDKQENLDDDYKETKPEFLKVGQEILVQINREPLRTKGAKVTTRITLPSHYFVLIPKFEQIGISHKIEDEEDRERLKNLATKLKPNRTGLIVRTLAEGKTEKELKEDLKHLLKLWEKIQKKAKKSSSPILIYQEPPLIYRIIRDYFSEKVDRLIINSPEKFKKIIKFVNSLSPNLVRKVELFKNKEPIFELFGIEKEIDKILQNKVWLKNGGYLIFDTTESMTTIDVNTGKYIGKKDFATTILKTNIESAKEISRQIRLRNISGIIVIDFIDMKNEKHQEKVIEILIEETKFDRNKINILPLTELGLVQMTRRKTTKSLSEILYSSCPYCEGKGKILSPKSIALKVEREIINLYSGKEIKAILVEVHSQVAEFLKNKSNLKKKSVFIKGNPSFHLEKINIHTGELEEIKELFDNLQEI